MGNFDVTTPAGSDLLSQGDDKIREFKLAVRESLRAGALAGDDIEGVEAIFPGASPSTAPVYRYRGLKGTTAARPVAGQYGLYFDTDRKVLQRDNGTSWEDIGQMVLDSSITEAKLSTSVAGDGLSGGANTPLSVNVGVGLEIVSDTVRISAAAAGDGISGGAGSALSVNVDDSTIGLSGDALYLKPDGVSSTNLTPTLRSWFVNTRAQASYTNQNDGSGVYNTVVNHSGLGRLLGVYANVLGGISPYSTIKITLDGTPYTLSNSLSSRYVSQAAGTTFGFTQTTSGSPAMDAMNILFSTSLLVEIASTNPSTSQTVVYVNYEKNT